MIVKHEYRQTNGAHKRITSAFVLKLAFSEPLATVMTAYVAGVSPLTRLSALTAMTRSDVDADADTVLVSTRDDRAPGTGTASAKKRSLEGMRKISGR